MAHSHEFGGMLYFFGQSQLIFQTDLLGWSSLPFEFTIALVWFWRWWNLISQHADLPILVWVSSIDTWGDSIGYGSVFPLSAEESNTCWVEGRSWGINVLACPACLAHRLGTSPWPSGQEEHVRKVGLARGWAQGICMTTDSICSIVSQTPMYTHHIHQV